MPLSSRNCGRAFRGHTVGALLRVGVWMAAASLPPPGVLEAQKAAPGPARPEPVHAPGTGYKLVPNDLVHVKVFREEDMEALVRVGRDGTIAFPLLGSVAVGGRTLAEATAAITQALREYLVNPQVAVRMVEFTKRRFTVLGQVNRPGGYELPEEAPLSLLEAIGLAGGYTRLANSSKITVKRSPQGGPEQVFHLDARQMARGKSAPPFYLQPGDTVLVEESLF